MQLFIIIWFIEPCLFISDGYTMSKICYLASNNFHTTDVEKKIDMQCTQLPRLLLFHDDIVKLTV